LQTLAIGILMISFNYLEQKAFVQNHFNRKGHEAFFTKYATGKERNIAPLEPS